MTLLGLRDDIPSLMNAADAFILTSHYEGFGLVLAEASHSGLPVVATESEGPVFYRSTSKQFVLQKMEILSRYIQKWIK